MEFFNDMLISQLLVLALLLITTLRPLVKKTLYTDSIAILSFVAVVLSALLFFIFGFSIIALIVFCISLLVFISNIASLYRLFNSLYSARYSTLFCFFSYAEAFFVLVIGILCILFRPVDSNTNLLQRNLYTGSFSRGFVQKESFFDKTNLVITEYKGLQTNSFENVPQSFAVIYLNPIGTTSFDSQVRLSEIANMGLNVFCGDFYAPDAPKTGLRIDDTINKNPVLTPFTLHFMGELTDSQKNAFLKQKELELETLLSLAGQTYTSVIIFAEGDTAEIAQAAQQKYPNFVAGVFSQTKDTIIESYYGKGFCDFAFTNPFDAYLSKFDNWEDFNTFRNFAKSEKPQLRLARLLINETEKIFKEETK